MNPFGPITIILILLFDHLKGETKMSSTADLPEAFTELFKGLFGDANQVLKSLPEKFEVGLSEVEKEFVIFLRDNFEFRLDVYLLATIAAVQMRIELPTVSRIFVKE